MHKILVIQTAFIGDVVLATSVLEKLHRFYPNAQLSILVRNGNQLLFEDHPYLHKIIVWHKKERKYQNWIKTLLEIRRNKYDLVINLQRFFSTGLLTALSGGKKTIGFNKNPLSIFFSQRFNHVVKKDVHEVNRNLLLVEKLTDLTFQKPKLYLTSKHYKAVEKYTKNQFVCIAPASVWFTKQFPVGKWVELINKIPATTSIYFIGAKGDSKLIENIIALTKHPNAVNLTGKLSFLESASLMQYAKMNYCNDSAPMHFASAVDAPITAIYCSTIPEFGFGPLSTQSKIWQTKQYLPCRPCGLHGKKACPLGHFKCAHTIEVNFT